MELVINEDGSYSFKGRSHTPTSDKNGLLEPYGKIVLDYGQVLELIPGDQEQPLNQNIGNARFIRNRYLDDRIAYYKEYKAILTPSMYKKAWLPKLREQYPFLNKSDKFVLEAAIEHVDNAFKKFYKKEARFPKFASKYKPSGNKFTSKQTNDNIRLELGEKDNLPYLRIPKIGFVRFVLPKGKTIDDIVPPGTRILSISVKRAGNRYTASLQLETVIDKADPLKIIRKDDIQAVDLGIKHYGVFGNLKECITVENPRWIKLHAKRLRRFQKALSRKQYDQKTHTGSKNREKAKLNVAKEHRKCANQRKDFQHKLSRKIADACTVFICEDLNIKGMMKNRHLSKAIASVGWGQFLTFVKYKLERKGGMLLEVNRWFPSSQICGCCGYKNTKVKDLTVREWTCPECGTYHDRDGNAMENIFREGVRMLQDMGIAVA